jgi:DNA-binding transcriptional LysR family regulator
MCHTGLAFSPRSLFRARLKRATGSSSTLSVDSTCVVPQGSSPGPYVRGHRGTMTLESAPRPVEDGALVAVLAIPPACFPGLSVSTDQLPHLETFCAAAERSNFTAAARALRLTQAAVSQRIQTLEQALGVALFRRRGGRVLLTEAGRRLYPYAQRILDLHREARAALTGRKAPVAGELSLAASSVPGEHLLPGLLADFGKKYPDIRVRATVTDSLAVLDQVERGQAHLGLVGRKADNPHLAFRPFAHDELLLVVPADHPWRRRKRVSLKELVRQPLILREAGSGSRWCLELALTSAGRSLSDLRTTLELGSNEAVKEAVLGGLGGAFLSTHVVQKELKTGQLHALSVSDLALTREMFVVWDQRRVLPIPAQLFRDLLEAEGRDGAH